MGATYSLVAMNAIDPDSLEKARASLPATIPASGFRWVNSTRDPSLLAVSQSRGMLSRIHDHLWNSGVRAILVEGEAGEMSQAAPALSPLDVDRAGYQAFRPLNSSGKTRPLFDLKGWKRQRRLAAFVIILAIVVVGCVLAKSLR